MKTKTHCRKCGAPLTPDARDSVCPRCLLALALASEQGKEPANAAPPPPVLTEGPGTIIGRYKLLQRLGDGGMDSVWVPDPPTVRYRAKKFVRQHRKAVAVAGGLVVLLTVASLVSTGLALGAIQERNGKEEQRQLADDKAAAESNAKAEAETQRERTEESLSQTQIQQAEYWFAADDSARAVAQLANVLNRDRSNRLAADRLLSALGIRNFVLPLTELRHKRSVLSARFSPDGRWMATASGDKARGWEIPLDSGPAPLWLPALATCVAGMRLNEAAVLELVTLDEFLKLKKQLLSSTETNYYTRWAKWFCTDPADRTISPLSSITVPEYVQRRIQENKLESLQEAVRLAPTNGLAFARLAKQVLAQSEKDNPRRIGEADFFSRYALKCSPNDPEVQQIRGEIVRQIGNSPNP